MAVRTLTCVVRILSYHAALLNSLMLSNIGRRNAPSRLHERNLVSPEFFDQREGLGGKPRREELAPPGVRAVIFGMPVKIGLQRASSGVRLVDHPHTRRQGDGEEIGD